MTCTINEQGRCSKGTAAGTFDPTVTAPEETSTINEQTSKVTGQLPIGAPAAPIRMVPLPEVPNGLCLRPDHRPLLPEFVSPFPLPGFISPFCLVDADIRTDQRLHPVQIQKPKTLGKKPHVLPVNKYQQRGSLFIIEVLASHPKGYYKFDEAKVRKI